MQQLYFKETQIQVFSCGYSETFKNRFFYRTLLVAASDNYESLKKAWVQYFFKKRIFETLGRNCQVLLRISF